MLKRFCAPLSLIALVLTFGSACSAANKHVHPYTCDDTDGISVSQVINIGGASVLSLQVSGGGFAVAGGAVRNIDSGSFSFEFKDVTTSADDDLILFEQPVNGAAQVLSLDNNPSLPVTRTVLADGWTLVQSSGSVPKVAQKYYGFEIRNYRVNPASLYLRKITINGELIDLKGGATIPCSSL